MEYKGSMNQVISSLEAQPVNRLAPGIGVLDDLTIW